MKAKLETPEVARNKAFNLMRNPFIAKVVLSSGAVGADLEKAVKLLQVIVEGRKAQIIKSGPRRRIPAFNVKPNMPLGTRITVRGKKATELLKRLLGAIDNMIKENQVADDTFSFGIKEYIEIPGIEYIREVGIRGFNVAVTFERAGRRVKMKKIGSGKIPDKQRVTRQEIVNFMQENFGTKIT